MLLFYMNVYDDERHMSILYWMNGHHEMIEIDLWKEPFLLCYMFLPTGNFDLKVLTFLFCEPFSMFVKILFNFETTKQ